MELSDFQTHKDSFDDHSHEAGHVDEAETAFSNVSIDGYVGLKRDVHSEHEGGEEDELAKSLLATISSRGSGRVETVRQILEKGVDPNKRYGGKKRTPMHEVLRRYRPDNVVNDDEIAEDLRGESVARDSFEPNSRDSVVVQLLLSYGGNVDVKDWQGNTSVHQAIVSNVPTDICRVLFSKSCEDVFADEEFKRLYLNHAMKHVTPETYRRNMVERRVWSWPPDNRWFCIFLGHVIATRPDWADFLQSTIEQVPLEFSSIVDQLLAFAATFGSADSVKFLLENGANPNAKVKCPVLLEASISARDAKAKINVLLVNGAVPLSGSFSNTDPSSSLCGAPSRRSAQDAKVVAMVFAGSNTVDSELSQMDFDYLDPLAKEGTNLIFASARPLQMALRLSRLFKKMIDSDDSNREDCQEMAAKFESVAVAMLDNASSTDARTALEEDILVGSVMNQQKVFVSNSLVQGAVRDVWYGNEQFFGWIQFFKSLLLFLIHVLAYSVASPFVWMLTPLHKNNLPSSTNSFTRLLRKLFISFPESPMAVVPYIAHTSSLILFFVLVGIIIHDGSSLSHFISSEWIICLFFLGMIEEEISQLKRHKLKRYLNLESIDKWIDVTIAVLLAVYFLLRLIVVFSDASRHRSNLQRAAVHVIGFIGLFACVRIITFWQAHSILGPIQISFRRVTTDVVTFLVILGMFLFGFSACVAAIYSSYNFYLSEISYSANTNNSGEFNETKTGQIPSSVDGMFNSFQSLFWGLFGIIDLEEFEVKGVETSPVETIVGTLMLAVWMVAAVIALLNLLIALISSSFENVQENADREWKYARAKIVFAGFVQVIPVPFNILSIPRRYFCVHTPEETTKTQVCYDVNFLTKITWANKQLVEQLQSHYQKQISQQTATKADVDEIVTTLNKAILGMKTSTEYRQVDTKAVDSELMMVLQRIREDCRQIEKRLCDRLSDLEGKLTEKMSALQTEKSE